MKKLLIGLLALGSISSFSADRVGVIREKNSDRKIEMFKDRNKLSFVLSDSLDSKKINSLVLTVEDNYREMTVETDKRNFYKFDIMDGMNSASGATVRYCWKGDDPAVIYGLFIAPVTTVPLCAVSHVAPYILGVILLPVDAVLTVGDHFFDSEAIAARKFRKLVKGKNKKASHKVFNSLVRQIKNL